MYYRQGVTQDYQAALKLFKLAADQGNAKAQYNLGVMYYIGKGVTQDFTRAYMWLHIAASQGLEDAKGQRSKIEKQMTSADVSKAQKLARECVAKEYKAC